MVDDRSGRALVFVAPHTVLKHFLHVRRIKITEVISESSRLLQAGWSYSERNTGLPKCTASIAGILKPSAMEGNTNAIQFFMYQYLSSS